MRRRAEDDWTDDLWVEPVMGYAEADTDAPGGEKPAAVLWLPDPEQYHGFREYYVTRAAKPGGKGALGFRVPDGKERR